MVTSSCMSSLQDANCHFVFLFLKMLYRRVLSVLHRISVPIHTLPQQAARFADVYGIAGRAGNGVGLHNADGAAREPSLWAG